MLVKEIVCKEKNSSCNYIIFPTLAYYQQRVFSARKSWYQYKIAIRVYLVASDPISFELFRLIFYYQSDFYL